MNIGADYLSSTIELEDASSWEVDVTGGGLALDLMLGGTLSPGFVLGGSLFITTASKPNIEGPEVSGEIDGSLGSVMLLLFADVFPDPKGGLNVGGGLGFDAVSLTDDANEDDPLELSGFGGAAWVGYGGWVGDEWQLGGLLRLAGSLTDGDESGFDYKARTGSVALLFSALYH